MNPSVIELTIVQEQDQDDTDSDAGEIFNDATDSMNVEDVGLLVNNGEEMVSDSIEMHAADCGVDRVQGAEVIGIGDAEEVAREEAVVEDEDVAGSILPRLPIVEYEDDFLVVKRPHSQFTGLEECDCNSYNCLTQDLVSVETGLASNPNYLHKNIEKIYVAQQRMMERQESMCYETFFCDHWDFGLCSTTGEGLR